jgi:hypothetical protein
VGDEATFTLLSAHLRFVYCKLFKNLARKQMYQIMLVFLRQFPEHFALMQGPTIEDSD